MTPRRVTMRATQRRAMLVMRQREASPGEPGCWAMLVKDSAMERRERAPSVAARM